MFIQLSNFILFTKISGNGKQETENGRAMVGHFKGCLSIIHPG